MGARLAPADPKILNNLGVAYARIGRYGEAAETLQRALLLDPELVSARYTLGVVYATKSNRLAAMEQYQILKTLAPDLGKELYKEIYRDLLTVIDR
jgi:tetratricopeptide (TPR) repeat protein